MAIDWNPLHSSLFTGAGTPWGPMETGRPERQPVAPEFARDPMGFPGFESTELRKQLERNIRASRARGLQGTIAQFSKFNPYGASSDLNRAILESGAQTEQDVARLSAELQRQDYLDRVQAMRDYNQNLAKLFSIQQQQYESDLGAYQNEQAQRGAFWGNLLQGIAQAAGAYTGAKAGAKAGAGTAK